MTKRPPLDITPPKTSPEAEDALRRIINIMSCLRNPDGGCEWDLKQTHETISPYTIEEAYEVAEAIKNGSVEDIRDELGDLLLQVVFQARIAEEKGNFDFADIADSISEKMIRRHPHVFKKNFDENHQSNTWEEIKALERKSKNKTGILDDIASTLPAINRAYKLQNRAARVGFDWDDPLQIVEKIKEELNEVLEEMNNNLDKYNLKLEEELGDLLFTVINLSRKLEINPDNALLRANDKFTSRFNYIEDVCKRRNLNIEKLNLQELENFWKKAKTKE